MTMKSINDPVTRTKKINKQIKTRTPLAFLREKKKVHMFQQQEDGGYKFKSLCEMSLEEGYDFLQRMNVDMADEQLAKQTVSKDHEIENLMEMEMERYESYDYECPVPRCKTIVHDQKMAGVKYVCGFEKKVCLDCKKEGYELVYNGCGGSTLSYHEKENV